MAKSYVKFEVSNEIVAKTYEALQLAKQSGRVRKGVNETTKSIERSLASFVVMATDVEPEEVIVHLPKLCEQKNIPFSYVPSKLELGKSIGLNVQCSAVAVENQGNGAAAFKDIISKTTGLMPKPEPKPVTEQKQEKQPKKEKAPKK